MLSTRLVVASIVLLLSSWVHSVPTLYISSPSSSSSFTLRTSPSSLALPLSYQIFDVPTESASAHATCFDIKHSSTQETLLAFTCIPLNPSHSSLTIYSYTITLNNVVPGDYVMSAVVQESQVALEASLLRVPLRVMDFLSSLPRIVYTPNPQFHTNPKSAQTEDLTVVLDPGASSGDLSMDFSVVSGEGVSLDAAPLPPCVRLLQKPSTAQPEATPSLLMNWNCLGVRDRNLLLRNVPVGAYIVQMQLGTHASEAPQQPALLSKAVLVQPLDAAWPRLSSPQTRWEFVSDDQRVGTAEVRYEVQGVRAAVALSSVCLTLRRADSAGQGDGKPLFSWQCMPIPADPAGRSIVLSNLPQGEYLLSVALAAAQTRQPCCPEKDLALRLLVHAPQAFRPSYDWQPLKVWHTVPAGAETRLPIGGQEYGHKEARIPQPWRLQLPLPRTCKGFFLRMDVYRHTTLREIWEAGHQLCASVPANCWQLVLDEDNVVQTDELATSAEASDLFNRDKHLKVDSACV
eukprot:gene28632-34565_t